MGYFDPDVYGEPEKFGLEIIAEIDDAQADYSFDLVVVWRETATGRKFWGSDSGCSCPSPFEGSHSINDLVPLDTPADWERLSNRLMGESRETYPLAAINEFMVKARL